VPTVLVLPVVKLMDTGFRAPWCSKCRDSGLVGLGVAMRMELCEMRMRIGLKGELDSNTSAVPSVEVSAPRSSSRSGLGLRLGGTVIVLGGPSCCWLMLVSSMSFPLGRGVLGDAILPVFLHVLFHVPVPSHAASFKKACLTRNHDCKAGHAPATWWRKWVCHCIVRSESAQLTLCPS
jgi:hypothetical protein